MRSILYFLLLLLVSFNLHAQEATKHTVQEGETLYSIARKYSVTPYNILQANKDLKSDAILSPDTVLIIPLGVRASDISTTSTADPQVVQDSVEQAAREEPIGFSTHRVRRRETLFGIAQRYDITEEDIKRYNRKLYAAQLKKGMRLRIPKYRPPAIKDSIDMANFETYTVQPKETRWSIAHKYGITLDSLVKLNPDLPKTTNHLAIGQELKLPKILGSSVDSLEVQLYESYTVPPKQTLYSIGKAYDIASAEIVRLNPEIVERGGLKEGMVLRLPKKKDPGGEVNTENFIFYEVKPKQTIYSLTRHLNIGYGELVDLNPDLVLGLKAGMVLKLPVAKAADLEVKNALILDRINLLDSIHVEHRPKLLYLLPFRTDRVDLNDSEVAINAIDRSNAIKYSLGLYTGSLIALDSIADLGVSVDVKTLDTELSQEKVKELLLRENLSAVHAVVGPLDRNSLKEVAVQAATYDVPVLAPLASESDISLSNVFFSITPDSLLRKRMLDYIELHLEEQNIIVISDAKREAAKLKILERFPLAKTLDVAEDEKNISINIDKFTLLLSEENENWIFVETDNFKLVSSVTSILNSAITEDIKVRMFTTNKNKAFENDVISGTHLSNLNFTYPSVYREVGSDAFARRYRRRFGSAPDRYAVRGFDLTFDLLLKLAFRPNLFETSDIIGVTEYTGNKFNYNKDLASGYFNTASYIMQYEEMRIKEIRPGQ